MTGTYLRNPITPPPLPNPGSSNPIPHQLTLSTSTAVSSWTPPWFWAALPSIYHLLRDLMVLLHQDLLLRIHSWKHLFVVLRELLYLGHLLFFSLCVFDHYITEHLRIWITSTLYLIIYSALYSVRGSSMGCLPSSTIISISSSLSKAFSTTFWSFIWSSSYSTIWFDSCSLLLNCSTFYS